MILMPAAAVVELFEIGTIPGVGLSTMTVSAQHLTFLKLSTQFLPAKAMPVGAVPPTILRLSARINVIQFEDHGVRLSTDPAASFRLVLPYESPLLTADLTYSSTTDFHLSRRECHRLSFLCDASFQAASATFLMVPWTSGFLNCRPNSPMYSSTQPSTPGF
jgi:hypothetical protein